VAISFCLFEDLQAEGPFALIFRDFRKPEQIQMAIRQALDRGITTPRRLRIAASRSSVRVTKFIERNLEEGSA